jgi:Rrf2 family protein
MRMSTRGRFGLRALLHLAMYGDDRPVPVSEIAGEMGISSDYLMQLFVKMRRDGLLQSVRGPSGGFKFAGPVGGITVADVVRCLEGSLSPIDCVREDASGCIREFSDGDVCSKALTCLSRIAWLDISKKIVEVFDSVTLTDILEKRHDVQSF